jgi:hypothetical protein
MNAAAESLAFWILTSFKFIWLPWKMLAVLSVSLPVREAEPACNDNYISCLSRIQYGNELGQMLVNSNDYI